MKLPFSNAFWSSIILLLIIVVFNFVIPRIVGEQFDYGGIREFMESEKEHKKQLIAELQKAKEDFANRAVGKYIVADFSHFNTYITDGTMEVFKDGTIRWQLVVSEGEGTTGGSTLVRLSCKVRKDFLSIEKMYCDPLLDKAENEVMEIRPWSWKGKLESALYAVRGWSGDREKWQRPPSLTPYSLLIPRNHQLNWMRMSMSDRTIKWNKRAPDADRELYAGTPDKNSWWIGVDSCKFHKNILLPDLHVAKTNQNCTGSEVAVFNEKVQRFDCATSKKPIYYTKSQLSCKQAVFGEQATIHDLAFAGDTGKLNALIRAGVDLNIRDGRGNTPLINALFSQDPYNTARLLIANGADPAATNGDIDAMSVVLGAHIPITKQTELVTMLLNAGVDPNRYIQRTSYLELAIQARSRPIVKVLLEHGAKADVTNPANGDTPLIVAVRSGNPELVELLLGYASNVSYKNRRGESAVSLAAYYPKTMKLLMPVARPADISAEEGAFLLKSAIDYDDEKFAELLLARNVSANAAVDRYKTPALFYAIHSKRDGIAKTLISAGADANVVKDGVTPLLLAIANSCGKELIEILIPNTGDLSFKAQSSFIPELNALALAERNHMTEVIPIIQSAVQNRANDKGKMKVISRSSGYEKMALTTTRSFVASIASHDCRKARSFISMPLWTENRNIHLDDWSFFCTRNISPVSTLGDDLKTLDPSASESFMRYVRYGLISGLDLNKTVLVDAKSEAGEAISIERAFVLNCTNNSCHIVGMSEKKFADQ